MSPTPLPGRSTPDVRAVVRALDALTTQVRRIADALTTPVVRTEVAADDDATTPATTCSAAYRGDNFPPGECIRAAGHLVVTDHTDDLGHSWPDAVAVYPVFDEPLREDPAADEDGYRVARRRDSLLNLLDRLDRLGTLTDEERALLRRQVQDEGIEADTARHVAAGNKRHVQVMYAELEQANEAARKALEQRQDMAEERYALQTRAEQAEELLRVAHETSNRSEAERASAVKRLEEHRRLAAHRLAELEQAQAAIERVRGAVKVWSSTALPRSEAHQVLADIRAALDGTEQPTTED